MEHGEYGFISNDKEKEIIVWVRLQENKDKTELIQFIEEKFDLDEKHAETLYYKALPDGVSVEELEDIKNTSKSLENLSPSETNEILEEAAEVTLATCESIENITTEFLKLVQEYNNTLKKV